MRQIPLSRGLFATVDDKDFEELSKYKWHAQQNGRYYYAARCEKGGATIRMSRQILDLKDPKIFCDHISGDTLDNRRSNLRAVTPLQNAWNKKRTNKEGYTGVFKRGYGKYLAQINHMKSRIEIGLFDTPEEASRAYNEKERELRGEFLRTNF